MAVPKRVRERFQTGLKKLVPILEQQRARDVSEADTVTLVKEVLNAVLGYDKWTELTGEYAIRGTFCDLAVKLDEKVTHLIEVKAIGLELKERHLKQAVGYAANEGIEWMILTNGVVWCLYNVVFAKPIDKKLVTKIDLLEVDLQDERELESLFAISKEGYTKGAHVALRDRQEALSRHLLAALLTQNRQVLNALRREVRRVANVRIEPREARQVLRLQVIKRDVLEDPRYEEALGRVRAAQLEGKRGRKTRSGEAGGEGARTTLADLLAAGTLQAPMRLHRRYKGVHYEATLHPDGTIELEGQHYESPSTAATALRSRLAGRTMNTNGWRFWRYRPAEGEEQTLAEARTLFRRTRPKPEPGAVG